jgi:ATP-binding protein involved in chromosome partitioning
VVTQEQVREALRSVNDPEIGRPIEDIGMLRDIEVLDGGLVRVHVLITIEGCPLKDRITSDVTEALAPLEGVERVEVSLSPMSEEQRASLVSTLRGGAAPQQQQPTFFAGSDTTVIAVA